MLARRLLLVVVAVAAAVHASAQCIPEPYTGTLETTNNNIPSDQQLCFNSLQVSMSGCSISVTSNSNGCGWLRLSGRFTENPATSVQASGLLNPGAAAETTFDFTMVNYDSIKLVITGEASTSVANYQVASGRMLQVKAAYNNNGGADLGGSTGTASMSTANCQGSASILRIAVSRSCPWLKDEDCLKSFSVQVNNCVVYVSNGRSDCPRFYGRVQSAGTSANLAVTWPTNSKSQSALGYGRKMLQGAGHGRSLKQEFSEGSPWGLFVAGSALGLRQGNCAVFFSTVAGSGVLGQ